MLNNWLTAELKEGVKTIFEPRYGHQLNDEELVEIANNLVSGIETICKLKQNQMYGK